MANQSISLITLSSTQTIPIDTLLGVAGLKLVEIRIKKKHSEHTDITTGQMETGGMETGQRETGERGAPDISTSVAFDLDL